MSVPDVLSYAVLCFGVCWIGNACVDATIVDTEHARRTRTSEPNSKATQTEIEYDCSELSSFQTIPTIHLANTKDTSHQEGNV